MSFIYSGVTLIFSSILDGWKHLQTILFDIDVVFVGEEKNNLASLRTLRNNSRLLTKSVVVSNILCFPARIFHGCKLYFFLLFRLEKLFGDFINLFPLNHLFLPQKKMRYKESNLDFLGMDTSHIDFLVLVFAKKKIFYLV